MKTIGLQVLGWLSVIVGFGLGLLMIRGLFLGFTRGFNAAPSQRFWIVLGYVLFLALCVYLFVIGKRALLVAKGVHVARARFGWGRMLLGSIFLYSYAVNQFHLIPRGRFKQLESANPSEAVGMKVVAVPIALGCIFLILSGIWRGARSRRAS